MNQRKASPRRLNFLTRGVDLQSFPILRKPLQLPRVMKRWRRNDMNHANNMTKPDIKSRKTPQDLPSLMDKPRLVA